MRVSRRLLWGMLWLLQNSCFAEIDLEVNQASIGMIPVSIEAINTSDVGSEVLANRVAQDLQHAEKINIVQKEAEKTAEFSIQLWRNAAQGHCMQIGYPQQKRKRNDNKSFCLMGKTERQQRMMAHQFADKAHRYITGQPSIFTHQIAYVKELGGNTKNRRYQIIVSDYDGYGEQVLMESQSPIISLTFSPQGERLAYVSYEEDLARIFIQDLRTGSREITAAFSGVNSAPSWSPDGKKLAMALSFSGITKLYIMDLATQKLEKITSGSSIDTEPFWRKDNQGIIFTSNRSGMPQIYEYHFANASIQQLTHYGEYNVAPQISSDGTKLVYLSRIDRKLQVVLEDLEKKTRQYLGNGNFDDTPRISPDDTMIMYATATKSGVGSMLMLTSVNGTARTPVMASGASLKHPSWSPVSQMK